MAEKKTTKKAPVKKTPVAKKKVTRTAYEPRLQTLYKGTVIPDLKSRFQYANIMEVPKLFSISLNMGVGDGKTNNKSLESAIAELSQITGQKPITTLAKKDISNFKIRR